MCVCDESFGLVAPKEAPLFAFRAAVLVAAPVRVRVALAVEACRARRCGVTKFGRTHDFHDAPIPCIASINRKFTSVRERRAYRCVASM